MTVELNDGLGVLPVTPTPPPASASRKSHLVVARLLLVGQVLSVGLLRPMGAANAFAPPPAPLIVAGASVATAGVLTATAPAWVPFALTLGLASAAIWAVDEWVIPGIDSAVKSFNKPSEVYPDGYLWLEWLDSCSVPCLVDFGANSYSLYNIETIRSVYLSDGNVSAAMASIRGCTTNTVWPCGSSSVRRAGITWIYENNSLPVAGVGWSYCGWAGGIVSESSPDSFLLAQYVTSSSCPIAPAGISNVVTNGGGVSCIPTTIPSTGCGSDNYVLTNDVYFSSSMLATGLGASQQIDCMRMDMGVTAWGATCQPQFIVNQTVAPAVTPETVTFTVDVECTDDGGVTTTLISVQTPATAGWLEVPRCDELGPGFVPFELSMEADTGAGIVPIGVVEYGSSPDTTPSVLPTPPGSPDGSVVGGYDPNTGVEIPGDPTMIGGDGYDPESGNCWASMWTFNPYDWVVTPLKCLFIPTNELEINSDNEFEEWAEAWLPVMPLDTGCGAYEYVIPFGGWGGAGDFHGELPTTCSGVGLYVAGMTNLIFYATIGMRTVTYTIRGLREQIFS